MAFWSILSRKAGVRIGARKEAPDSACLGVENGQDDVENLTHDTNFSGTNGDRAWIMHFLFISLPQEGLATLPL